MKLSLKFLKATFLCLSVALPSAMPLGCSKSDSSQTARDSSGAGSSADKTPAAAVAQRASLALLPELTCGEGTFPVTNYVSSVASGVKFSFPSANNTSPPPPAADIEILTSAVKGALARVPKVILDSFQIIKGEIYVLTAQEVTDRCLQATNRDVPEGKPKIDAATTGEIPYCHYSDYEITKDLIRGRQIILLADRPHTIRKGLPESLATFYTKTFLRTEKIFTEDGKGIHVMDFLPLGEKPSQGISLRDAITALASDIGAYPPAQGIFDVTKGTDEQNDVWLDRLSIQHGTALLNLYMCDSEFSSNYLVQSSLKDVIAAVGGVLKDEPIDSRKFLVIFFPKTFIELRKIFSPSSTKSKMLGLTGMPAVPSPESTLGPTPTGAITVSSPEEKFFYESYGFFTADSTTLPSLWDQPGGKPVSSKWADREAYQHECESKQPAKSDPNNTLQGHMKALEETKKQFQTGNLALAILKTSLFNAITGPITALQYPNEVAAGIFTAGKASIEKSYSDAKDITGDPTGVVAGLLAGTASLGNFISTVTGAGDLIVVAAGVNVHAADPSEVLVDQKESNKLLIDGFSGILDTIVGAKLGANFIKKPPGSPAPHRTLVLTRPTGPSAKAVSNAALRNIDDLIEQTEKELAGLSDLAKKSDNYVNTDNVGALCDSNGARNALREEMGKSRAKLFELEEQKKFHSDPKNWGGDYDIWRKNKDAELKRIAEEEAKAASLARDNLEREAFKDSGYQGSYEDYLANKFKPEDPFAVKQLYGPEKLAPYQFNGTREGNIESIVKSLGRPIGPDERGIIEAVYDGITKGDNTMNPEKYANEFLNYQDKTMQPLISYNTSDQFQMQFNTSKGWKDANGNPAVLEGHNVVSQIVQTIPGLRDLPPAERYAAIEKAMKDLFKPADNVDAAKAQRDLIDATYGAMDKMTPLKGDAYRIVPGNSGDIGRNLTNGTYSTADLKGVDTFREKIMPDNPSGPATYIKYTNPDGGAYKAPVSGSGVGRETSDGYQGGGAVRNESVVNSETGFVQVGEATFDSEGNRYITLVPAPKK